MFPILKKICELVIMISYAHSFHEFLLTFSIRSLSSASPGFELTLSEFTEKECIYYARNVSMFPFPIDSEKKICELVIMISYAYSFHEFLLTFSIRSLSSASTDFELTRSEFTEKVNECIYYARKVCFRFRF